MRTEEVISNLYENALNDRPSFSDAMLRHMRQEIDKIKNEALKWHQEHKKYIK